MAKLPDRITSFPAAHLLLFTVVACLVALLSYCFFFPGYVHPFAIYHDDHFIYQGMGARGYGFLIYFQQYPRPVAHVLVDLSGRLGPYYVLAPVFFCSFFNAGLVSVYIQRVLNTPTPLTGFVLFSALCFGNPEFYVHVKADPFSVFALSFLLIAFHCWQTYAETGYLPVLLVTGVVIATCSLTKESYFICLGLFFVIQVIVNRRRRTSAVFLLLWSGVCIMYALHRDVAVWVLSTGQAQGDVYHTSLAPTSLFRAVITLAEPVLTPPIGLAISAILAFAWFRSRTIFLTGLISLCFGIASWLPNATLPNHLEAQYSCLGIFFVLTPLLLLPRIVPQGPQWLTGSIVFCIATYIFALRAYTGSIYSDARWVRTQERSGMNLLAGLERMKVTTKPGQSSLVTGVTAPYSPFRTPPFITNFFGYRRFWTVVVPDAAELSAIDTTRLIHASDPARLQPYSHWFVFDSDGKLVKTVNRPTPASIAPELTQNERARLVEQAGPPFGSVEFYAIPDPIPPGIDDLAQATLFWKTPARLVEVRIDSPDGKLFAGGGSSGKASTGKWLTPNMEFYLQDAAWGRSTDPDHTLATLRVKFAK